MSRRGGQAIEHVVDCVPVKRQQRLLEKVCGGRPTSEVVKSTPVGAAAINNAPKISDFKEGTTEERIRAHAAAMVKWSTPNLTRRAIEKETRVRRRRIELGKSYMLQLYAMLAYTGQVLGLRGPLQRLGGTHEMRCERRLRWAQMT